MAENWRKFVWTDENVAKLRELVAKGQTAAQIGHELGHSRNAIIGKVIRMGLTLRHGSRGRAQSQGGKVAAKRLRATREPKPKSTLRALIEAAGPKPPPDHAANDRVLASMDELPPDHGGKLVSLVDLETTSCRWPIGNPKHDAFGFCGEAKVEGTSYCMFHVSRAFQLAPPRPINLPIERQIKRAG